MIFVTSFFSIIVSIPFSLDTSFFSTVVVVTFDCEPSNCKGILDDNLVLLDLMALLDL